MAIDPLVPPGVPRPDAQRTDGAVRGKQVAGGGIGRAATDAATGDQVQLSDAAATSSADGEIPTGTLSPEQVRRIGEKLASGAYDDPAVAANVAKKLIGDGPIG